MDDFIGGISVFLMWGLFVSAEIYGLYLSILEGALPFCIALVIPPWAILKGILGFLSLIF